MSYSAVDPGTPSTGKTNHEAQYRKSKEVFQSANIAQSSPWSFSFLFANNFSSMCKQSQRMSNLYDECSGHSHVKQQVQIQQCRWLFICSYTQLVESAQYSHLLWKWKAAHYERCPSVNNCANVSKTLVLLVTCRFLVHGVPYYFFSTGFPYAFSSNTRVSEGDISTINKQNLILPLYSDEDISESDENKTTSKITFTTCRRTTPTAC